MEQDFKPELKSIEEKIEVLVKEAREQKRLKKEELKAKWAELLEGKAPKREIRP